MSSVRLTRAKGKKSLKIALVMPPSPYLANDLAYPPMGLLYLASSIREFRPQHEVQIVELGGNINWKEETSKIDADVVGIQCVSPNHNVVKKLVKLLEPSSIKIIGGVHPTYVPEVIHSELGFDIGVQGEGEVLFLKVLDDIVENNWKPLYRSEPISDLDSIPMPAIDMVDLTKYTPGGEPAISLQTSRGCHFKCTYCSMVNGKVAYQHSVERVVEEVKRARDYFGVNHFVFSDDNAGINLKRLKGLLDEFQGLGCTYRLNMSVGYITEEVCESAARAGVTTISFGLESFSAKMLKLMQKPASVKSNCEAIRLTKKHGMKASIYLIANYPGETEETVDESLEYFVKEDPDVWLLSNFVPLPGSRTWSHPEEFGIIEKSTNWDDYYLVGNDCSFKPAYRTKELTHERQIELHNRYYNGLHAFKPLESIKSTNFSNKDNREKKEKEFTFFDLPVVNDMI